MPATGQPGEYIADQGRVALSPFLNQDQLWFQWGEGSQTVLHTNGDCLGVKTPEGNVTVFFPNFSEDGANTFGVVGGTVSIKEDPSVQDVTWGREILENPTTVGRLTIRRASHPVPGSSQVLDGIELTYSGASLSSLVTMQLAELHVINEQGTTTYEHEDPNVVFKPVSNPPRDASPFPTCG